jgi:hypothetical protein
MSERMDNIYDNHIIDEKLKTGTKYERLAAVVYKIFKEDDVVIHDLRLRGDGKTAVHQIDVTIEKQGNKKRILVECKDYDDVVGIGIIRDFYGAVAQIKPDDAIVITTQGFTRGAVKFAKDENIKLAILKEFSEEDWEGRLRRLVLNMRMVFMDTPHITSWLIADPSLLDEVKAALGSNFGNEQKADTTETYFYNEHGDQAETFQQVLQPIFNSFPRVAGQTTKGKYEFERIRYIKLCGITVPVRGFDYEFNSHESVCTTVIDEGAKVAILLYKMLDGTIDTAIFDQQLEKWTFDEDGQVISKEK